MEQTPQKTFHHVSRYLNYSLSMSSLETKSGITQRVSLRIVTSSMKSAGRPSHRHYKSCKTSARGKKISSRQRKSLMRLSQNLRSCHPPSKMKVPPEGSLNSRIPSSTNGPVARSTMALKKSGPAASMAHCSLKRPRRSRQKTPPA